MRGFLVYPLTCRKLLVVAITENPTKLEVAMHENVTLLVKDETVIGFEPRYDFPFNQGKLCPKGVKRYLQGAHPDRLLLACWNGLRHTPRK
jgi:hypothetical protein